MEEDWEPTSVPLAKVDHGNWMVSVSVNFIQYEEDLASHAQTARDLMQWQVNSMTHLCWHYWTYLPTLSRSLVILSPLSPLPTLPHYHLITAGIKGHNPTCGEWMVIGIHYRTMINSFCSIEQQGVCVYFPSLPSHPQLNCNDFYAVFLRTVPTRSYKNLPKRGEGVMRHRYVHNNYIIYSVISLMHTIIT